MLYGKINNALEVVSLHVKLMEDYVFRVDPTEADGVVDSVLKFMPKAGKGQSIKLKQWTKIRDRMQEIDAYVQAAKKYAKYEKMVFVGDKVYVTISGRPYNTIQVSFHIYLGNNMLTNICAILVL